MPLTYCDVLSSLWRSFLSMACFFDCFCVRNDPHHPRPRPRPHLAPNSSPPSPRAEVAEKIHLSSLFAAEEKKECVVKEQENLILRVGRLGLDESLLEEVKLLKACGTLPETPAEIRKAVKFSEQVEKSDIKMPLSALQSLPDSPSAIQTEEVLLETFDRENSGRPRSVVESSPETPEEKQEVEFVAGNSEKLHARLPSSMMKASPYATPRKITDDMQTPGTVYATNLKSLIEGNGRIRSQYVNTTLNPIDTVCQLQGLKEENTLQSGYATPLPVERSSGKSVNEETMGDATLASWLKPRPGYGDGDGDGLNQEAASLRKPNVGKTLGDRPIIGLVATHWNEQEKTPHVLPKWWDGNGIPNSTTKYKEDQKVRWHATPFEERLEKALSEETCVPRRKPTSGAPLIFEEFEGEEDTATSQLKTTPKSVVSF